MPAPTKLFKIINGNSATIDAETVTRGTLIWYRDNAAKLRVIDNFAIAYGYPNTVPDPVNPGATIPNPQSKQSFFTIQLYQYMRDVVRGVDIQLAQKAAADAAAATSEAEIPSVGEVT